MKIKVSELKVGDCMVPEPPGSSAKPQIISEIWNKEGVGVYMKFKGYPNDLYLLQPSMEVEVQAKSQPGNGDIKR